MPAPLPPPPPLHLLRALLREASYLPDAAARAYFGRYIVARFKAYQPAARATASPAAAAVDRHRHRAFKRRRTAVIQERAAHQQRKARAALNLLRRANQGDGPCLQKLLRLTYGRLGRRKHALLDDLLKPDPAWPAGPAPLQLLYRSSLRCLHFFDAPAVRNGAHVAHISRQYPRLRATLAAQCQRERSLRRPLKRPFLKTPILNAWEQPMPLKRAVNNVRRWYAETMTRLLPPLPAAEWDHIQAMSAGRQRIGFVKRRTPAAPAVPDDASRSSCERTLHHHLAMDKLSKADRPRGVDQPHPLTARYMQRLYARLLTLSCKLEYDDVRKQWNAVWGESTKTIKSGNYAAPVDDALFAGVDANGRVPKTPRKKETVPGLSRPRSEDGEYLRFPFFAEWLPDSHPMRVELDRWKKERDVARAKWAASGGDV